MTKTSNIYIHKIEDPEIKNICKNRGNLYIMSKDMIETERKKIKQENKKSTFIYSGFSRQLLRQANRLLEKK